MVWPRYITDVPRLSHSAGAAKMYTGNAAAGAFSPSASTLEDDSSSSSAGAHDSAMLSCARAWRVRRGWALSCGRRKARRAGARRRGRADAGATLKANMQRSSPTNMPAACTNGWSNVSHPSGHCAPAGTVELEHVIGGLAFRRSGTHCMSAYLVEMVLMLPVTSIQNAMMHCAGVMLACTIGVCCSDSVALRGGLPAEPAAGQRQTPCVRD